MTSCAFIRSRMEFAVCSWDNILFNYFFCNCYFTSRFCLEFHLYVHWVSGVFSTQWRMRRGGSPGTASLPRRTQISLITTSKRSLGQGNVFTCVCHSVHGGGSLSGGSPWQRPPWTETTPPPYGKERPVRFWWNVFLLHEYFQTFGKNIGLLGWFPSYMKSWIHHCYHKFSTSGVFFWAITFDLLNFRTATFWLKKSSNGEGNFE